MPACIHPGCAGCKLALRHLPSAGFVWPYHGVSRPGALHPTGCVFSSKTPLVQAADLPCFPGGEALTLTECVHATSLPWGTRSKVSTTARPCWRPRSDLGGSLEMPLFCLELPTLPVQVHQVLYFLGQQKHLCHAVVSVQAVPRLVNLSRSPWCRLPGRAVTGVQPGLPAAAELAAAGALRPGRLPAAAVWPAAAAAVSGAEHALCDSTCKCGVLGCQQRPLL